jgi:hypothetical protein
MIPMRRIAIPLLIPFSVASAQHAAHEAKRLGSDSLSVMATLLTTTVSPSVAGRSRSELQVTQPMIALRGARFGSALQYVTMLNFERWTMPGGEAVAGIWGEGFIDRRHPHTVAHELMISATRTTGIVSGSIAVGKGFAPFGTDDPMVRPFTKYPANHHLAQVMERIQLVAALRLRKSAAVEAAFFNGDEPLSPTAAPQWNRFGDSRSVRLTVWPVTGLELQGSLAAVRSPEFVRAEGLDHAKLHTSARWTPDGRRLRYLLAEWGRTTEKAGSREIVAYRTGLFEALAAAGPWGIALRAEQTSRPEDERLLDQFRTTRPPNHFTIQGVTRWRVATAQVSRVLPRVRKSTPSVFVEVARASSAPQLRPVLLDPRDISGAATAWHITAGLRVGVGAMAPRAGRYGVAAGPTATNVMLGMLHGH